MIFLPTAESSMLLLSADLVDALFVQCQTMAPVQQWLVQVDKRTRGG